jgi:type II secretory pathway component PulF
MERAGLPLQQSIARLVEQGAGAALATVQARLAAGEGIEEAFAAAQELTELERRLIGASAKGGRLPDALDQLADHFEGRAAIKRAIAFDLAYPLLLLHAAVFLPNLPLLVTDGAGAFAAAVLTPLGICYGALAALVLGWRALRTGSPETADGLLLSVPVLGGLLRKQALVTSLRVLQMLYASGVSIIEAAAAAAAVCPNRSVGRTFTRVRERLASGSPIGAAFAAEPTLPTGVIDLITSGELAGTLDDMIGRAARQLDDEAKLARRALLVALGGAAFLVAAGVVAYKVIAFYSAYFNRLNQGF